MATTAISVEEYLRTSYDPDMEYVDGQLVERHVGEYFHSRLQFLIAVRLGLVERERRYRVFTEQRVRIAASRYLIPDIAVKALPHEIAPVLTTPDLVIEIVSPDDAPADVLLKVGEYQQAGFPYIWVVDPYKRALVESVNGAVRRPSGLVLATPLVGDVDFAALFAQLDEPAR